MKKIVRFIDTVNLEKRDDFRIVQEWAEVAFAKHQTELASLVWLDEFKVQSQLFVTAHTKIVRMEFRRGATVVAIVYVQVAEV